MMFKIISNSDHKYAVYLDAKYITDEINENYERTIQDYILINGEDELQYFFDRYVFPNEEILHNIMKNIIKKYMQEPITKKLIREIKNTIGYFWKIDYHDGLTFRYKNYICGVD